MDNVHAAGGISGSWYPAPLTVLDVFIALIRRQKYVLGIGPSTVRVLSQMVPDALYDGAEHADVVQHALYHVNMCNFFGHRYWLRGSTCGVCCLGYDLMCTFCNVQILRHVCQGDVIDAMLQQREEDDQVRGPPVDPDGDMAKLLDTYFA